MIRYILFLILVSLLVALLFRWIYLLIQKMQTKESKMYKKARKIIKPNK